MKNDERRKKINAAQLTVLMRRLADGIPLTAAQMQFVNVAFPELDTPSCVADDGENLDDIAVSANELAKRLGVHRQTIAYHKGRSGSPPSLSVSAWRRYLAIMGKLPTCIGMEKTAPPEAEGDKRDTPFAIAFEMMFRKLSDALPTALHFGLSLAGVKLTPRRTDKVAWGTWLILAGAANSISEQHELAGPLDPEDGSACELPQEIEKLAARVAKELPKPKPAAPDATSADQPETESPEPPEPPSATPES
jgi:hypothetical protein